MSFRELIEALSPDEIEKITGRKPKSGVHTQSIKPEHRANGQPTVPTQDSDDSKGYGKRRYMGDDVEAAGANLEEGDVNYAKMHTQANPKYASGTKWRKSSAAVKAKADDVGAGELGAHNGGSGHVAVKATMNQRDKLADRQEINALGHKTFAIKQTRLPRTSVRKPLPEGLEYVPGEFRKLVEAQLNEISRGLATSYISGAKSDEHKDRSSGIKLAQKKKWGDAKFGFEEPKVKATSEEAVSEATRVVDAGNSTATEKTYHVQGLGVMQSADLRPNAKVKAVSEKDAKEKAAAIFRSRGHIAGQHYTSIHAKAILESVLNEAYTRADHWMAVANHALHNATSYPYDTEEHHKWMTVHHKAMSIHGVESNNHEAEHSHSLMSERHADMAGGDEEFHNGESHHWSRF